MIPGMFCTAQMPERIGKYLQDDFFVILPTLDGHHVEEPVDHSKVDDGKSIRRIADTCYKCDLPPFDTEATRRFTFLYSENEPARKAEKRLRKTPILNISL